MALGLALVIDLGRSSLASDRVAWGTLELNANRVVPVAAPAGDPNQFTAAAVRPALDDRPRLLRFTADWCGPCQTMKSEVFAKPHVADAIHERFAAYSVDLTQPTAEQQALGQHYRVQYLPTLIITDAQGKELARLDHAADADDFLGWLDRGWQQWDQSPADEDPTKSADQWLSPVSHAQPVN